MRVETLSVFPHMFDAVMGESIMKRARQKGIVSFEAYDLRNWTHDVHKTTDDAPYGGGPGLLMKPEPIFEALDDLLGDSGGLTSKAGTPAAATVIFTSPAGERFTQKSAEELASKERLIFVCGHYEGFDERVYSLADKIYSVGDFVLTGGELPAMIMIDAICRLLPGVLGDDESAKQESFCDGLLEYPQYTRPASFRGMDVPDILLSGDHGKIAKWRRIEAIKKTALRRPDMLKDACISQKLTDEEIANALQS